MVDKTKEYYSVVIDIGDTWLSIGFAGESLPKAIVKVPSKCEEKVELFPPFMEINDAAITSEELLMGYDILVGSNEYTGRLVEIYRSHEKLLTKRTNSYFDMLHEAIREIFTGSLFLSPYEVKALVVDNSIPLVDKVETSEMLLTKMGFNSLVWKPHPLLVTIGAGEDAGMVINIGWRSLTISTIFDLRIIQSHEERRRFTGKVLYYRLIEKLLALRNSKIDDFLNTEEAVSLLQKFCLNALYVREDHDEEDDRSFRIADDILIPNRLRYEIVEEGFFQNGNLVSLLKDILVSSSIDLRDSLLRRLILTGPYSQIPGLKARVIKSLQDFLDERVNGISSLGSWAGGSLYFSNILLQTDSSWKNDEITRNNILFSKLDFSA